MRAATQERAPTGRIRLFRLTHVIVVLTNVLQLLFMITLSAAARCLVAASLLSSPRRTRSS